MTPTQLVELINATDTLRVDEREQLVIITARMTDAVNRTQWLQIVEDKPGFLSDVRINYTNSDEEYTGEDESSNEDEFLIALTKVQREGELLLLFQNSLKTNASLLPNVDRVRIADIQSTNTFKTYRSIYEHWDIEASREYESHSLLPNPREYVVELSIEAEVPADIRPWLLLQEPEVVSVAYCEWNKLAQRPLIAAISDRVTLTEDNIVYHFSGPPACSFSITDQQLSKIAKWLMESVCWVYTNEPRDANARHLLLASEWARSFRRTNLDELGKHSLEAAQAAYRAYIKSQSRETLKVLSDLRKIVLEETQIISNRAHELAKSMWKDFAVASAPFVVKILSDASQVNNEAISVWLAYLAAVFLTFSIIVQIYLNERWILQQRHARRVWELEINTGLTTAELNEVSKAPVAKAICDFRIVKWVVVIFYVVVICLLINHATEGRVFEALSDLIRRSGES